MNKLIKWFIETCLILSIIGLIILIFLPLKDKNISINFNSETASYSEDEAEKEEKNITERAPKDIAAYFGWKEKIKAKIIEEVIPTKEPPTEIDWLKPMGFVAVEDEKRRYWYKNLVKYTMNISIKYIDFASSKLTHKMLPKIFAQKLF